MTGSGVYPAPGVTIVDVFEGGIVLEFGSAQTAGQAPFSRSVTSRSTKSPRRSSKTSSSISGIFICSASAVAMPVNLSAWSLSRVGVSA